MPCGATQDSRVMVERSDRMWSTAEGNGKPLQYSCLENHMNSMRRQNDRIVKEELPRSVGAQYATGDQWRNNSRKNEGMEPKQKQYPVVDVTGNKSKIRCCKKQYCIGTWNVRSMNQGKLEVVKQKMARVNIEILGISKLKNPLLLFIPSPVLLFFLCKSRHLSYILFPFFPWKHLLTFLEGCPRYALS